MHKSFFLSILVMFLLNCRAESVETILQSGLAIDTADKEDILRLAKELDFDSPYQIEAGIFGKYDSSKVIIVKQLAVTNDTLQQEKWLYVWRREWTNSQFFRSFGDSSIQNQMFVTGPKCIRMVDRFIYRHDGQKKIFQFTTRSGSYKDVRLILDCVLNGTAIEDSMTFREETKDTWKIIKDNVLGFKAVMKWSEDYAFDYDVQNFNPTELQLRARIVGNACLIYYAGPRGAGN